MHRKGSAEAITLTGSTILDMMIVLAAVAGLFLFSIGLIKGINYLVHALCDLFGIGLDLCKVGKSIAGAVS